MSYNQFEDDEGAGGAEERLRNNLEYGDCDYSEDPSGGEGYGCGDPDEDCYNYEDEEDWDDEGGGDDGEDDEEEEWSSDFEDDGDNDG